MSSPTVAADQCQHSVKEWKWNNNKKLADRTQVQTLVCSSSSAILLSNTCRSCMHRNHNCYWYGTAYACTVQGLVQKKGTFWQLMEH